MVDISNKCRNTLNRWHKKHFVSYCASQRRKQLTHKICHDILSQSALNLAVIFCNSFLTMGCYKTVLVSKASPPKSLSFLLVFYLIIAIQ